MTEVHAIEHSNRYGSYHTCNLEVALLPVLGHISTTVHTPGSQTPDIGDAVADFDRSDPGYAELPAQPANSIETAIVGRYSCSSSAGCSCGPPSGIGGSVGPPQSGQTGPVRLEAPSHPSVGGGWQLETRWQDL